MNEKPFIIDVYSISMANSLEMFNPMRFNSVLKMYAELANEFLFFKIDKIEIYYDVPRDEHFVVFRFKNGYTWKQTLGPDYEIRQYQDHVIYDVYMKRIRHFIERREDKLKDIYDKNQALLNLKSDDDEVREYCKYILKET